MERSRKKKEWGEKKQPCEIKQIDLIKSHKELLAASHCHNNLTSSNGYMTTLKIINVVYN